MRPAKPRRKPGSESPGGAPVRSPIESSSIPRSVIRAPSSEADGECGANSARKAGSLVVVVQAACGHQPTDHISLVQHVVRPYRKAPGRTASTALQRVPQVEQTVGGHASVLRVIRRTEETR